MIDIHCHILPGVDDGATDQLDALNMARMAQRSGVTEIAVTPHVMGDKDTPERLALICREYERLEQRLAQEGVDIKLHPGAEVLCLPGTPELAENRQLPTLGRGNYVLAEFYFDESFSYMDQMLQDIASRGYKLVVAHPERYAAIQRDPSRLERWGHMGYVLQLNKGSILGALGSRAQRAADEILGRGLAHLIASDAHGCRSRTPHMGELSRWVQEHCDPYYARILLEKNPRRVLEGRPPVGMD